MKPHLAQNPDPRSRAFTDAGHAVWTTLVVLAGAALALRAGDAIPGWISAVPRGVHLCASLDEAEARTGLHLGKMREGLAGYALMAGGIRTSARPMPSIAVASQSGDGRSQLTLFHSQGAIPTTLRPPLPSFHEIPVPLGPGMTASLKAKNLTDGSVWQDLEWSDGSGHTALRFNGRTVDLLRLARQLAQYNQDNDDHEDKP
jgi:hypothetical protein